MQDLFTLELKRRKFDLSDKEFKDWYDFALYALKLQSARSLGISQDDLLLSYKREGDKITLYAMAILCQSVEATSFAETNGFLQDFPELKMNALDQYLEYIELNVRMTLIWNTITNPMRERVQKMMQQSQGNETRPPSIPLNANENGAKTKRKETKNEQ